MDLYHYTWFECVSSYGADLADKTFLGLQSLTIIFEPIISLIAVMQHVF